MTIPFEVLTNNADVFIAGLRQLSKANAKRDRVKAQITASNEKHEKRLDGLYKKLEASTISFE